MIVRALETADFSFLWQMLLEAACWRSGADASALEEVLARPEINKVLQEWGRSGDHGLVLLADDGSRIGAAWYRSWSNDNHSVGFIHSSIPELGIAIDRGHQRLGAGTQLMKALLDHAHQQGYSSLSLSVACDNPARIFYGKLGFIKVELLGNNWTMLGRTAEVNDAVETARVSPKNQSSDPPDISTY